MDLTVRPKRTYRVQGAATPQAQTPSTMPDAPRISAYTDSLDELAARLDKGWAILRALQEEEDTARYDATLEKWQQLDNRYRRLFAEREALLGKRPDVCVSCDIEAGIYRAYGNLPPTARLCPRHSRELQAERGRMKATH